jgi:hypothetical protein
MNRLKPSTFFDRSGRSPFWVVVETLEVISQVDTGQGTQSNRDACSDGLRLLVDPPPPLSACGATRAKATT